ncbi:MAG: AGE family epimerase/isomerase [Marinicaulis sp.]|nr:AGE family epimerase/isomerase [Marinicaulis sp.]
MTVFDRINDWMFNDALPFWAERGVDHRGGVVEELTLGGEDAAHDYKRTRVACRQAYVYAHAKMLGCENADHVIDHCLKFLRERAWSDAAGGFIKTTDRDGAALDQTLDLYDHAFALYAFSWGYRATGNETHRQWMERTQDAIETHLAHPSGLGFCNDSTKKGWRRQNPHMHLLEASLAAIEAGGGARFETLARSLCALFDEHLFDAERGVLPEIFDDSFQPADCEEALIVEPGHHFEWTWIIANCQRLLDVYLWDKARALSDFGEGYGVDRNSGAVFNSVTDKGAPVDGGSRTWPNTERIKAAIARFEIDGDDPSAVIDESAGLLLDRYLNIEPRGLWIDSFDSLGAPLAQTAPTSTFYHVFLAFAEILRVKDKFV